MESLQVTDTETTLSRADYFSQLHERRIEIALRVVATERLNLELARRKQARTAATL